MTRSPGRTPAVDEAGGCRRARAARARRRSGAVAASTRYSRSPRATRVVQPAAQRGALAGERGPAVSIDDLELAAGLGELGPDPGREFGWVGRRISSLAGAATCRMNLCSLLKNERGAGSPRTAATSTRTASMITSVISRSVSADGSLPAEPRQVERLADRGDRRRGGRACATTARRLALLRTPLADRHDRDVRDTAARAGRCPVLRLHRPLLRVLGDRALGIDHHRLALLERGDRVAQRLRRRRSCRDRRGSAWRRA